jgi:hypothetical protein
VEVRRAFILDLTAEERVASDLSVGGVFVPNATVDLDDECRIILRAGDEDVTVDARVVQITETGAGFQIEGMTDKLRERISALVELAKHVNLDLERKKTEAIRRAPVGSIPPVSRRGGRIAEGSISPIVVAAKDGTESDD